MPPRAARAKRGTQSASGRAWDRAINHLKDIGGKIQRAAAGGGHGSGLSEAEVDGCVNDLSVIILQAENDDCSSTPGVWAALSKSDGMACLLALYGVSARCSSASLAPGLSDSLRLVHAKLRAKLAKELNHVFNDVEGHMSKRDVRTLARGLLGAHMLRCYAALLSDATKPLMTQLQQHAQGAAAAAAAGNDLAGHRWSQVGMSPHRRLVKSLSDLLGEAADVLWFLKETSLSYDYFEPWSEMTSDKLATEVLSSGLLEFASRGLLLLASCEGCALEAASQLENLCSSINAIQEKFSFNLGAVLSASPSLSLLLSAHVTQLTAALDGGTTYGLSPAAAPWAAPLLLRAGGAAGRQLDVAGDTSCCIKMLELALSLWSTVCNFAKLSGSPPVLVPFIPNSLRFEPPLSVPPPPLDGGPPRSVRQAANAYLCRLEASAEVVERAWADAVGAGGDGVREMMVVGTALEGQVVKMRREANRVRQIATAADALPMNVLATVELCLRLTAAAWEALASGAGAGRSQRLPQGQQQQQGRLRLTRAAAAQVAQDALRCAKAACGFMSALATRMELPRRAVQQLEGCWREWLAWAGLKAGSRGAEAQRALREWTSDEIGGLLAMCPISGTEAIPDKPLAPVAAAIAAGYISGLEWLLRRLSGPGYGQWPQAAALMKPIMSSAAVDMCGAWQQLLAFAPRHDVIRFLDTLSDLVWQAALSLPNSSIATTGPPGAGAGAARGGGAAAGRSAAAAGEGASGAKDRWEEAMGWLLVVDPIVASFQFRAQPAPPQQQQEQASAATGSAEGNAAAQAAGAGTAAADASLGAVLSYVAVRLLPAVAELLQRLLPHCASDQNATITASRTVRLMLRWINMLAAAAPPKLAGSSAPPPSPGEAGPSSSPSSSSSSSLSLSSSAATAAVAVAAPEDGWAEVLIRDLGVFSFLPAVIALRRRKGNDTLVTIEELLEPIVGLAALLPRQLAAAMRQEAPGAAVAAVAVSAVPPLPCRVCGGSSSGDDGLWDEVRWLVGSQKRCTDPQLMVELERLRNWTEPSEQQQQSSGSGSGGPGEQLGGVVAGLGGKPPPTCERVEWYAEGLVRVWRSSGEFLLSPAAARALQPAPVPTPGLGLGPNPLL